MSKDQMDRIKKNTRKIKMKMKLYHIYTYIYISSLGRQDLVTQFLVKITFLYKLVAKKNRFCPVQIADFNLKR